MDISYGSMYLGIIASIFIIVGMAWIYWTYRRRQRLIRPADPSMVAFALLLIHWLLDLFPDLLPVSFVQSFPVGFLLCLFGLVAASKERYNHWGFTLILGTVSLIRLLFLVS